MKGISEQELREGMRRTDGKIARKRESLFFLKSISEALILWAGIFTSAAAYTDGSVMGVILGFFGLIAYRCFVNDKP